MIAPKSLRGRTNDPCRQLLTPSQLTELGFANGAPRVAPLVDAVECSWSADDQALSLAGWDHQDVLVDAYRAHQFRIAIPIAVSSLPALMQRFDNDNTFCTLSTGVANGQGLVATVHESPSINGQFAGDPCALARAATEAVVSNLPPLS